MKLQVGPARFGRHPEHPLGGVLVTVFEQAFELHARDPVGHELGIQFIAPGLERIGDVLQEQQAEDDVLVLSGVDLPAQGVGGLSEDLGSSQVGVALLIARHHGSSLLSFGGDAVVIEHVCGVKSCAT